MKVSKKWIKQLIDLKVSIDEVIRLLPLRTIGLKEVTESFFELDMKGYNRADLLSMRGVAYEIAAITSSKVTFDEPEENEYIWFGQNLPKVELLVENNNLCPLYCAAKIEGLRIGSSSREWIQKLQECGVRTINNVADITNLVMLKYGQPMHAFDTKEVKDETLIVRTAKSGETLVTLDETTRLLEPSDILITDSEKALGLAGVMGGKNSEITDSTSTILLEAAIFDPVAIRKTAQRLNLPSEASKRFQHGLTKKRLLQAFDAAIDMYQDLGGKLTAISITGNLEDQQKIIELNHQNLNSLIGVEIPAEDVEKYLTKLNFKLASQGLTLQGWQVTPPYFRLDVNIEADVIEEIARMYGYEKIPPQKLQDRLPEKVDQSLFDFIYNLKTTLVNLGFTEIQTYSFYSVDILNNLNLDKNNLIKIVNPISSETEYLRDELWPNLLGKIVQNLKQGFNRIAIFEIGKTYYLKEQSAPEEKYKLALALSDESDNTIQKLYSVFQKVASHMSSGKVELGNQGVGEKDKECFHPTRFTKIISDKKEVGYIGEIHPRIVDKFGTEKRIAVLEIDLIKLL